MKVVHHVPNTLDRRDDGTFMTSISCHVPQIMLTRKKIKSIYILYYSIKLCWKYQYSFFKKLLSNVLWRVQMCGLLYHIQKFERMSRYITIKIIVNHVTPSYVAGCCWFTSPSSLLHRLVIYFSSKYVLSFNDLENIM